MERPGWLARAEHHVRSGAGWMSDGERAYAESKTFTKRRNEFIVARWTLKQAVAQLLTLPDDDATLARIEARHGSDGAPALHVDGEPAGFDISMTDRSGWAVSVIAPPGSGVGCDLELVEPRSPAFVRDYLTESEQQVVAAAARALGPHGHSLAANLLWSAKESALKVLHTGLREDTRSVVVTLEPVHLAHEGDWAAMQVTTAAGERFDGWWCRTGQFILTTCARRPLPPPQSLDGAGLSSAVPKETWQDFPLVAR